MRAVHTRRLGPGDTAVAREMFRVMGEVFEEATAPLTDEYVNALLRREDLWVMAAWVGDDVAGGATGHVLPMTRSQTSELLVYDIAVRADLQRRGIGRRLLAALLQAAADAGIDSSWVPADNEDTHALDFYRSLGGEPGEVTIFSFRTAPSNTAPSPTRQS